MRRTPGQAEVKRPRIGVIGTGRPMCAARLRTSPAPAGRLMPWDESGARTEDEAMRYRSGRHFLQIPGPTNVPDRVLRAMAAPTIDHRGPQFAALAREVLAGLGRLCGSTRPVAVYPSSGTGAWEAALVNTLSPGDRVLAFDTGQFATLWAKMAADLGLRVDFV